MAKETVMVVDDEQDILELIAYNLEREGYSVIPFTSGEDALTHAKKILPDIIILDLMLPGIDGLGFCKQLKLQEATAEIPIIMLTAKTEDSDIISGLEVGADDYITKPFSPKVLIARIRAVLRRKQDEERKEVGERICIHNIVIDIARHEVISNGNPVNLSATEFSILEFLARNQGWVFGRNKIIDAVKGKDYPVTERSVDVQILGLRKKLGEEGKHIQTVRGVGYRMKSPEIP
jgi:two-component system, OmpR family, alkaline phosphatase synthesis response regulator PhoP